MITLGFSTCPNDTFIFDALIHGKIDTEGLQYQLVMKDILHLNQMARAGELDMIKVSYNTYGHIRDQYHLLDAGSALGHKCGPLLISKEPLSLKEIIGKKLKIAIPGKNTTANLLLGFYASELAEDQRVEMIFDEVMPAVLSGKADAGVIIHENRFTYQQQGLQCIQDLGDYWEAQTGLPIPLGGIVVRKSLGEEIIAKIERQLRASVEYAMQHPEASMPFVREYAQEMDDEVMKAHIALYVNQNSVSLGEEGRAAVAKLLEVGRNMKLFA